MDPGSFSSGLTCSVCGSLFCDPVTLSCGHSFCRGCSADPRASACPQCGTRVPDGACLSTNVVLEKLVGRLKEVEEMKKERGEEEASTELCAEHGERLKLFCVSDQQLACIVCRDQQKHDGHQFRPVGEAAAALKADLLTFLQRSAADISAMEELATAQRQEMSGAEERLEQLLRRVGEELQEMQHFLKEKEEEVKKELRRKEESLERMGAALAATEAGLAQSRRLQGHASSALAIADPERFFRTWAAGAGGTRPELLSRSTVGGLQLETPPGPPASPGPHHSHLQFFVWKEMLQLIRTRAARLTLRTDSPGLQVSGDGRSLFWTTSPTQLGGPIGPGLGTKALHRDRASSGFSFGGSAQGSGSGALGTGSGSSFDIGSTTKLSGSGFSFNAPPAAFGFSSGFGSGSGFVFGSIPKVPGSGLGGAAARQLGHASSVETFTSGQVYWEVEVGSRKFLQVGLETHFLKSDGHKYSVWGPVLVRELELVSRPRKVGVYVDLSCEKVSFYDADRMVHIHSTGAALGSRPVSAHFSLDHEEPDPGPMTVCWY